MRTQISTGKLPEYELNGMKPLFGRKALLLQVLWAGNLYVLEWISTAYYSKNCSFYCLTLIATFKNCSSTFSYLWLITSSEKKKANLATSKTNIVLHSILLKYILQILRCLHRFLGLKKFCF